MASTKLDIFNLAASAISAKSTIADVNETSREAELCRLWYDEVLDQLLHAAPWSCAKAIERLTLVKERDVDEDWVATDPDPGWRFSYEVPSDMIRPRYISTYERFVLSVSSTNARVLLTQVEDAILIYTKKQETVTVWDPQFTMAMAYGLASHLALPLTGKPERAKQMIQLANIQAMEARTAMANEDMEQFESMPEWVRARGYAGFAPETRYFYPFGNLLSPVEGVGVR